jgi:hypothetical protein
MRNVLRPLLRWTHAHCVIVFGWMFGANVQDQLWTWFN